MPRIVDLAAAGLRAIFSDIGKLTSVIDEHGRDVGITAGGNGATYATDPLTGKATAFVDPSGGNIPINGFRTTPLRIATFGDSTANVAVTQSPANQDVSKVVAASWQSGLVNLTASIDKYATEMFYPLAYLVGNGGISGQSTTQMLARDTLAASITRYAITDIINLAPHVVLLRGGSINDLLSVTSGTLASTVAATYANHIQIIQRFMSANIPVIDTGIYGFANGTANTVADLASTLSAITQLNTLFATYAAQYPGKIQFISPTGLVSDASGAYLPNMSADGTHLTAWGQYQIAPQEAVALTRLFGASSNVRYQGQNNHANSLFANTGVQGYGTVATGLSVGVANATRANAKIETINGKLFQTCEITITGASSNSSIYFSYDPTATASGMVAAMAISSGDIWGFEFDFYLAPLSGSVLNIASSGMNARVDTRDSVGSGRILFDRFAPGGVVAIAGPYIGHFNIPPIQYGDTSANLTTASSWLVQVSPADTSGTYKIGVSQPRIVKLNQPVNTI